MPLKAGAASQKRLLTILAVLTTAFVCACNEAVHSRRRGSESPQLTELRSRGNKLFSQRLFAEAAVVYEQGYRLASAERDARSMIRFLNNLGSARFAMLDYSGAIDAYVRAKETGPEAGDANTLLATAYNLASLYLQIGDVRAAQAAAEYGLTIQASGPVPYACQIRGILGVLRSNLGDTRGALSYFVEAVRLAEQQGDERLRLEAWNHYGRELLEAGRPDEAEVAALQAYRLGRQRGAAELRPVYLLLARIARLRGDLLTALTLSEKGLGTARGPSGSPLWEMYFRSELAHVYLESGKPNRAVEDLRRALSLAREWRESIAPSDKLRRSASHWLGDVYDSFVQACTERKPPCIVEAFLAVEEERAAALAQTLARTGALPNRLPIEYWRDVALLRAEMAKLAGDPSQYDSGRIDQLQNRLLEYEARAGLGFIPVRYKTGEKFSSGNILKLQRNIGPDEAVISLRVGQRGTFLWALTNRGVEMHRLPPAQEIAELAQEFGRSVEKRSPDRDELGERLYSILFARLSAAVERRRHWLITADDALFEAPLAALVVRRKDGRPVYLVESHSTEIIPSAYMLLGRSVTSNSGGFLGIGDAIYNTADSRLAKQGQRTTLVTASLLGGVNPNTNELPRLVGSALELSRCSEAWSGRGAMTLLTGANCSRERLQQELATAPAVIHFASHILQPPGHPEAAFIHLGLGPDTTPQTLTDDDITNLRIHGSVVVLSGCSSAAAHPVRGAGVMGLTRAFLIAGAHAVIGSRWPTPDDTGQLFRTFYESLRNEKTPYGRACAESLRLAQVRTLRSETWRADPAYWSAFYLVSRN